MFRSPLRYAGGKSRAVKEIFSYIEKLDIDTLCSPFFGGGSIEIHAAQNGIKIYGYDYFKPLTNFWHHLLINPKKLADAVSKYHPLQPRQRFYDLQRSHISIKDSFQSAVIFYVLNRTSFSGSTLSGGMASGGIDDNPRFTQSSIDRIRNFKMNNLTINYMDFRKSIKLHNDKFLYLDPPYLIAHNLYGVKGNLQKGFDHIGLNKELQLHNNWILSYNDSKEIRDMYSNYKIIIPHWSYSMSKNKKSNEVLIFSKDAEF